MTFLSPVAVESFHNFGLLDFSGAHLEGPFLESLLELRVARRRVRLIHEAAQVFIGRLALPQRFLCGAGESTNPTT